jgi:exonuclease VII small subunit
MQGTKQKQLLEMWLQGNQSAIECANILAGISQTYDDLIDKDQGEVSDSAIHEMMSRSLIALNRNQFFVENREQMIFGLERAFRRWREANDLEANGSVGALRLAYVIRSAVTDLVLDMAYMVGGEQWGRTAAFEIRRFVYDQSWEDYVEEMSNGVS